MKIRKKEENGFISELDRITKDEKQAIWKCKECGTVFKDDEARKDSEPGIPDCYCPNCGAYEGKWRQIRAAIR